MHRHGWVVLVSLLGCLAFVNLLWVFTVLSKADYSIFPGVSLFMLTFFTGIIGGKLDAEEDNKESSG